LPRMKGFAPMSTLPITARRFLDLAVVMVLSLSSVSATHAQCAPLLADPSKLSAPNAPHEQLLPESGHLSDAVYTSDFFGFALDLPIASHGHLIKLPLMPERQHALLAIAYQNGDRSGSLTIDAIDPREGLEGFSTEQQQQLSSRPPGTLPIGAQPESQNQPQVSPQGTLMPPQPKLATPQFQLPTERFHSSVRHKGEKYTALYWTQIRSYRVGVLIATNDKDFLQKAKQAMAGVQFYCTADDGTLATKDGKRITPEGERYEGPTVPTWRAAAAIQSAPGLAIPPGEVSEGAYRNSALGMQYKLPKGWNILPTHNGGDPPANLDSLRQFEFLHACSRTLLRIQQPGSADIAPNGRPPLIVLRALDPTCLSLRTPAAPTDARIAEEVGVSLESMTEFGEVASHDLVSISGQLFMVFRGTIAVPGEGGQLAQRMSQTIFATNRNKMLLVWSFMAPTFGELATMPADGISFDGSPPIELGAVLAAKR
jgi:hypothetical protein